MNVRAIKDLRYEWYLKIFYKVALAFRRGQSERIFKYQEFNGLSFHPLLISVMTEKITKVGAFIRTAVQIKNKR